MYRFCQAGNRFLGSLKGLQIRGQYDNLDPALFLAPIDCSKIQHTLPSLRNENRMEGFLCFRIFVSQVCFLILQQYTYMMCILTYMQYTCTLYNTRLQVLDTGTLIYHSIPLQCPLLGPHSPVRLYKLLKRGDTFHIIPLTSRERMFTTLYISQGCIFIRMPKEGDLPQHQIKNSFHMSCLQHTVTIQ